MKILQVYHIFPALFGGVSTVVYQLTKELSRKNHEVDVLTTNAHFKQRKNGNLNGINVYRFPLLSDKLTDYNIVVPKGNFVTWVKDRIKKYDCIHIHGFRNIYNLFIRRYSQKYKIPYVLQAHGSLPRVVAMQRFKWIYDVLCGYRLLKNASKVIVLSSGEAEQCKAMGVSEEKIALIPNGIDLSEYINLPPKGIFKKKYNIPNDKKVILYLGRIHKTKRTDFLIKAYAYLVKDIRCDDTVLALVGPNDGYLYEARSLATSSGVATSVLFTGFISNEDKLRALVDADVFVTPSFYGFPVTFLEACATGTPIITTNLGDTLNWINGNVGYVTSPSICDMAEAIYTIVSNDELYRKFSRNCMRLVESNFSIDKVASRLERIYEEVTVKSQ